MTSDESPGNEHIMLEESTNFDNPIYGADYEKNVHSDPIDPQLMPVDSMPEHEFDNPLYSSELVASMTSTAALLDEYSTTHSTVNVYTQIDEGQATYENVTNSGQEAKHLTNVDNNWQLYDNVDKS